MTAAARRALCCLAALLAVPAAALETAQSPFFVESPAFGGASMFVRGVSYRGRDARGADADSFFALGYAQGETGADRFFSRLEDLRGGDAEKSEAAARGLMDGPWGARSRGYGLLVCEKGASLALSREETTSLWALRGPGAANGIEGFEVRRAVGERLSVGYAGRSGAVLYGSTLRLERWALGATRCGLPGPLPDDLFGYTETQRRNFSYAMDAFLGAELAAGLRFGVQANRLDARRLGDVEEGPQYRAGVQIDIGQAAQLTVERDINEAARLPFPAPQRSESASLRIRANGLVTLSAGAERRFLGGASSLRFGAAAWLTGKRHRVGAGFQFGGDGQAWGAAWRMQ
jgi:hypothetical protein